MVMRLFCLRRWYDTGTSAIQLRCHLPAIAAAIISNPSQLRRAYLMQILRIRHVFLLLVYAPSNVTNTSVFCVHSLMYARPEQVALACLTNGQQIPMDELHQPAIDRRRDSANNCWAVIFYAFAFYFYSDSDGQLQHSSDCYMRRISG